MARQTGWTKQASSWLRAILGKLHRWLRRLFMPNRGRRAAAIDQVRDSAPVIGINQFRHPEQLTVQELFAKVQWQMPKQTAKTVANVRQQINWD
ncbi:MAG: hypothetical protein SFT94_10365 [Pseudanabaenaceae cyanobacterium bins.68]|nr:hypothetical protein [Pseudanabaenaceae cyanobacterium bins.68]